MSHIMHHDVVNKMRNNNRKVSEKVVADVLKDVEENYIRGVENDKTSDEALFVFVYHRKGNDIITSSHAAGSYQSSLAIHDVNAINIIGKKDLVK